MCAGWACLCSLLQQACYLDGQELLLTLCHGDIEQKLKRLKNGPDVSEDTTSKIQQLCRLGFSRQRVVAALRLVGYVSWSTAVVERGHGSSAVEYTTDRPKNSFSHGLKFQPNRLG